LYIVIAGWHVYSADYYFKELARQYWITILCVIVEYLYYQFILKRYCHVTDKAESSPRIKKQMGSENSFEQCDAYPTASV
jgi:hypothetical protein